MEYSPPPAPSSSGLAPGKRFGAYQIVQRIGAGGMGEVFRAKDTRLGREVAIKTITLDRNSHADSIHRFEQEARSASSLNHPNIVTIYELGQHDGTHYIAMELLSGPTLRDLLRSGPLTFHKAVSFAAQLADALAKAHEIGIVHRDLKPENVIVTSDDIAKIVDFGLAKLQVSVNNAVSETAAFQTQPGALIGTVGYMSPEQANGQPTDFRSDQFSFGAVLFEMVSGNPAFLRRTSAETLVAIMREAPGSLGSAKLNVPAPFLWIVERCLAKEPQDRYASTRDLARDLAAVRDRVAETPARSPAPRPSNLPIQRTPFIGRVSEAAALRELLLRSEVRMVTLTGPGGIGKTRLALHAASEAADGLAGGTHFVPLGSITDTALVVPAVAQAIGVRPSANQPIQDALTDHLRSLEQPVLLLLDNFEHLLAAGPLIAGLITSAPNLKVMVTSQSPLHIYGEHEFPVPPLEVADTRHLPSLHQLAKLPAIALFVERAQAVKREFALTAENAAAVATICARLDGLPLAIELAAARVKLLSPAAMQSRLESSLSLLTGGARDLPTRQQTLRGTIDWSFGLLNEAEQRLFRRLSVFVGGCTFEGVEAVCDARQDLGLDVLDGMASMLDKSLVRQVNAANEEPRFVMLSTIREYALERLRSSPDETVARRAHAAYCIVLAEESSETAADQSEWLVHFDAEHDNFRTALDWLTATGNADWGFRLGAALFRYWEAREYLTEGRERLAALLALPAAKAETRLRAQVLFAAGVLAGEQGDYAGAHAMMEDSLVTARAVQDERCVAIALNAMAVNARDRGELHSSSSLFEQSLAVWRQLGDSVAVARAISNLANVAKLQQDYSRASLLYDECLSIFRRLGDGAGAAWSLNYKGDVACEQHDLQSARALYEQSLAAFRQLADDWGIASVLSDLGNLSRDEGNFAEAQRLYAESLRIFQQLGHKRGIARLLESLATSAAARGDSDFALRMGGAAAALRQGLGARLTPVEEVKLEKSLAVARQAISNDNGLSLWMKGWAMPLDSAVREALAYRAT
jgi:predicted ATPase